MRRTLENYIGKKINKLTIFDVDRTTHSHGYFICKCDCGNMVSAMGYSVIAGRIKSCGCLHDTFAVKHKGAGTKLYGVWRAMKQRCANPKNPSYKSYGGRGIKVCAEWEEFNPFKDWALNNGYEEGLSIERIDNNRGYSPENCRWATFVEQQRNTQKTHWVHYNGKKISLCEICERNGIPIRTYWARIYSGWDEEKAFTTPPRKGNYHKSGKHK